jgi:hypothetical protein
MSEARPRVEPTLKAEQSGIAARWQASFCSKDALKDAKWR